MDPSMQNDADYEWQDLEEAIQAMRRCLLAPLEAIDPEALEEAKRMAREESEAELAAGGDRPSFGEGLRDAFLEYWEITTETQNEEMRQRILWASDALLAWLERINEHNAQMQPRLRQARELFTSILNDLPQRGPDV